MSHPIVVVGNGWSALGAVGFLTAAGIEVRWITQSGARMLAPLCGMEWGPGVEIWAELARLYSIEIGEQTQGSLIREYRNKAFRSPAWTKAPTPEARNEVRDELLWSPERRIVGTLESRFALTLNEIDEEIRKQLNSGKFKNLKKFEGIPITFFKKDEETVLLTLGSGEVLTCSQMIFADRWSQFGSLEGTPKTLGLLRKREPMGVLQANLTHSVPIALGVKESFYVSLHREAKESVERHVWGHFSADGKHSVWTICLSPEELEDNHGIAKKFRRMKTALEKVFSGSELMPTPGSSFAATILEEQVRFEEESIFTEGAPLAEPLEFSELGGVLFVTDGYGPAWALKQVGSALDIQPKQPEAEVKSEERPEESVAVSAP